MQLPDLDTALVADVKRTQHEHNIACGLLNEDAMNRLGLTVGCVVVTTTRPRLRYRVERVNVHLGLNYAPHWSITGRRLYRDGAVARSSSYLPVSDLELDTEASPG